MITAMTPDQVALAMQMIYREGVSKAKVSRLIGVNRGALNHALHEAPIKGFKAFSLVALKSRAEPLCKGKTLSECNRALFDAGLFEGSNSVLRRSMNNAGIDYRKMGSN